MTPSTLRTRAVVGFQPVELAILGLFFLSGASALVYEVVWTRGLTNTFGGSAFAIATVLAAFMAGLALGSKIFGRSVDRRGHPLVLYAALEAGIGLWALVVPVLLGLLDGLYGSIYRSLDPGFYTLSLVRFVLCFLVILVPATMMGGTLPVLGKLLLQNWSGLGNRAGILYGINTLGAVVGVAGGGFLLLPTLGLQGAVWVAVGINMLVAGLALVIARRHPFVRVLEEAAPGEPGAPPVEDGSDDRMRRAVLVVYAASGFAALAYEVAWTKTLSMILGTTTYAFTSMLTTFLLGLALGSFLFGKIADRLGRPQALLALVQLGIPLAALGTIPLLEHLPQMFVDGFTAMEGSWFRLELYRIFLAALTMFVPTVLMGGTFPLVTRVFVRPGQTGSNLGTLYAANTVGAILGSFLAGFVLVPWIGRQNTILAATFINVVAVFYLVSVLRHDLIPRYARWGLGLALVLMIPAWVFGVRPWNPRVMASGAYIYARNMAIYDSIEDAMSTNSLLFYDEATEATVSVWQLEHVTSLRTNGKVEASSHGDMVTQKLISHLPNLYHQGEPREALMIGLASGISVGSLLTYPLERVDTIELMPSMLEAARVFEDYNRHCLDDPRHRIIINDGRNHLLLSDEQYDVIVSEPSNPWIAGVGSLFTREFFELTKQRLAPGGVVCQWVQTYQFHEEDLKTILATFADAYPHLHLWQGAPGDLVLVGSLEPLRIGLPQLRAYLAGTPGEDLDDIELLPEEQVLSYFVTDRDGLREYLDGWPGRVTDDNLYLEYAIPRHMFDTEGRVSVLAFDPVRRPVIDYVTGTVSDSARTELAGKIDNYRTAHTLALNVRTGGAPVQLLAEARRLAPEEYLSRHILAKNVNEQAIDSLLAGQVDAAKLGFERVAAFAPSEERAIALNNLGTIAYQHGDIEKAGDYWREAKEEEPNYTTVNFNLSLLALRDGRVEEGLAYLRHVIRYDPTNSAAQNNYAYNLAKSGGDLDEAERHARIAVEHDPTPGNRDTLGYVLLRKQQWTEAVTVLEGVVTDDPAMLESLLYLGMARAGAGDRDSAQAAFREVMSRSQDRELARRARTELEKL